MRPHPTELGPYLDRLAGIYGPGHLESDPIAEVRRFERPEDRELAAFLAAGLAFAVAQIDREIPPMQRAAKGAGANPERRAALEQGVDVLARLKKGLQAEAKKRAP